MATFTYKAIGFNGEVVTGTIEGDDREMASERILSSVHYLLSIKQSNDIFASMSKRFQARGVKTIEIIEFANNLAIMLKSGIPISTALTDLTESTENRFFQQAIHAIRDTVEMGGSFSSALAAHTYLFPKVFIHLMMVGEETGRLDKSLADVGLHLQKMEDLSSAIKRALIYPVFAFVATMGALLFWLVSVFPKMMVLFENSQVPLPPITRMILFLSDFFTLYWHYLLVGCFPLFFLFKLARRNKRMKYAMDMVTLKLPVIKLVVTNKILALFSEQLRILTSAGITIDRAYDIVSKVIDNEVFKVAIIESKEDISIGSRISDALKKHTIFPHMVTRMIGIGETSGKMEAQFAYLSEYYMKKLDDLSDKIGKMIEPIVIGFVGMLFALMIIGFLLPLYDTLSTAG